MYDLDIYDLCASHIEWKLSQFDFCFLILEILVLFSEK